MGGIDFLGYERIHHDYHNYCVTIKGYATTHTSAISNYVISTLIQYVLQFTIEKLLHLFVTLLKPIETLQHLFVTLFNQKL